MMSLKQSYTLLSAQSRPRWCPFPQLGLQNVPEGKGTGSWELAGTAVGCASPVRGLLHWVAPAQIPLFRKKPPSDSAQFGQPTGNLAESEDGRSHKILGLRVHQYIFLERIRANNKTLK